MGRITSEKKRNYIINGEMLINQRYGDGNGVTSIANDTYMCDRFTYSKVGGMVQNYSHSTDVPTVAQSGRLFSRSLQLTLTTPDTSIASTDRMDIQHRIEGFNWANLAQKTCTLSFWVKATLTGTYCVGIRNSGTDRSYVAEYTINATDTWEHKTIVVTASPSAGTWNYNNGVGVYISFVLAAGSSFHTTAGAWQTGNFLATSNQVNGVNTGATDFRITGVMMCEGTGYAPFSTYGDSYEEELTACQRYYEKSWEPQVSLSATSAATNFPYITSTTPTTFGASLPFNVEKRTPPTVTIYSPAKTAGQLDLLYNGGTGTTTGSLPVAATTTKNFRVGAGGLLTSGNNGLFSGYWAAEAEL